MPDEHQINKSHVLCLKEVDGKLLESYIPIEDCAYLLKEIDDAVENPNKTLMDVQSLFLNEVHPIRGGYPYPYPYKYDNKYVGGESFPEKYSHEKYTEALNERLNACQGKRTEEEIKEIVSLLKKQYAAQCKRYIQLQMLHVAFQKAEADKSIKIYSREEVGWSHFEYMITDDIKVRVSTNFCYGSSSYFLLTISYKGIVISPFSHLVKYYYANMTDIIRCTRNYYVERDSWYAAIDFIKDFGNQSLANPEAFVEEYLMNEINEMMEGLKNIMDNPESVIKKFAEQGSSISTDYHRLRLICPMVKYERKRFDVFKNEMPIVFKAEKLAQAVKLLERLKEIANDYQEINCCISEICDMTKRLAPEVQKTINGIKTDVANLLKQKAQEEKNKERLNSKLELLEDKLNGLIEDLPEGSTCADKLDVRKSFEKEHEEYKTLKERLKEATDRIWNLKTKISSRESLISRLSDCIKDFSICASYENIA